MVPYVLVCFVNNNKKPVANSVRHIDTSTPKAIIYYYVLSNFKRLSKFFDVTFIHHLKFRWIIDWWCFFNSFPTENIIWWPRKFFGKQFVWFRFNSIKRNSYIYECFPSGVPRPESPVPRWYIYACSCHRSICTHNVWFNDINHWHKKKS